VDVGYIGIKVDLETNLLFYTQWPCPHVDMWKPFRFIHSTLQTLHE